MYLFREHEDLILMLRQVAPISFVEIEVSPMSYGKEAKEGEILPEILNMNSYQLTLTL